MKRLYRSRKERILGGVCGGIAEYLETDPTVVRLVAVLLILLAGSAIVAYLIAWIVIPEKPKEEEIGFPREGGNRQEEEKKGNRQILAWILLVIGILWLSQTFSHFWFRFIPHPGQILFPLILVVGSVILLLKR
ncbi:MAG: PspC domain-containing protein [Atribacterota bacterium]|nr:PspC domain-containing protein [Atribacterota bacterium]